MADRADEPTIQALKALLARAWQQVHDVTGERVYAFGVHTTSTAEGAWPFACGEVGLQRAAAKYIARGIYPATGAADNLRWSVADSPYEFDENPDPFASRPDVHAVSEPAAVREIHFRHAAACRALKELDAEGLFGTGDARPILWLEGGDIEHEWTLKWAKKLNPPAVFARFKALGEPTDTVGRFAEVGTTNVEQTSRLASAAGGTRVVTASGYDLFLFDTTADPPRQLASRRLPQRRGAIELWDVATSADAGLTAAAPAGPGSLVIWLVSGADWERVVPVRQPHVPSSVAVDPVGRWVAVTCWNGQTIVYDPAGQVVAELARSPRGHERAMMAVSPDGSVLALADGRGDVRVWESAGWAFRGAIDVWADGVGFDPTGTRLVTTFRWDGGRTAAHDDRAAAATVFDVATGDVVRTVEMPGYYVHRAVFSPDGRHLACAVVEMANKYRGIEVALLDARTGRVVDRLRANFEAVYDFAFLPHRGEVAVAVFGHTRRPLVLWRPAGVGSRPGGAGTGTLH